MWSTLLVSFARVLAVAFFMLVIVASLCGQATNVSQGISGTVQDPNGKYVAGATVSVRNVTTGVETQTTTTDAGIFSFPQLTIGTYLVKVVKNGFKTFERTDVTVDTGEMPDVGVQLSLGAISEMVSVSGVYQPTDKTSTDSGTTRSAEELEPLPVQVNGGNRDPIAYLETFAGVNFTQYGGGQYSNIQGTGDNGGFGTVASYKVDGIWASIQPTQSLSEVYRPAPELVQEMRLVTNGTAEQGWNLGVSMELVTKSGTNRYHGTAYEYLGNDDFDARSWLSQSVSVNKQNDFGIIFGGPIIKNKHFFIASYSGYRQRLATAGQLVTVPTTAMTNGDFSGFLGPQLQYSDGTPVIDTLGRPVYQGEIYNPTTTRPDGLGGYVRDPFMYNGQLNHIDPTSFSGVSSFFQKGFPAPNLPGTGLNFNTTLLPSNTDKDSLYVKTDHDFGAHKLSFSLERVLRDGSPTCTGPGWAGFGNQLSDCTINSTHLTRIRANYTWVLRNNLLLGIHGGINYNASNNVPGPGAHVQAAAGLSGTYGTAMPVIGIAGFQESIGQATDSSSGDSYTLPIDADLTWVRGKHELKFGMQWMHLYLNDINDSFANGQYSFGTDFTNLPDLGATNPGQTLAGGQQQPGIGYAQFLLGYVSTATVQSPYHQQYASNEFASYAQDQWRLTPKLTINYGLRYNLFFSPYEAQNRIADFCPTCPNPAAGNLPGALTFWGSGPGRNGRRGILDVYPWAFDPRLGAAYAIDKKTVARVYWGIQRYPMSGVFNLGATSPNFGAGASVTVPGNAPTVPAFVWDQGTFTLPTLPNLNPTLENGQAIPYFDPKADKPGAAQNIGVSVERELTHGMYVRAKYVGKLMHGIPTNNLVSMNQLPLDAPEKYGNLLFDDINSPEAQAAGIPVPYAGFTGPVWQALRPYPQYSDIENTNALIKDVYYHAGQFELQKSRGPITFLVAYTISKVLSNDPFYTYLGAGLTPLSTQHTGLKNALMPQVGALPGLGGDRPQVLEISWVYNLPVGRNRKYLSGANSVVDAVIGGWTLAGIHSYQAGTPFFQFAGSSIPTFGLIWPKRVAGVPIRTSTSCGDYNPFDPSRDAYLNATAFTDPFTNPTNFALGDSLVPPVRLCGYLNENFSLQKNLTPREGYRIEIGIDAFNAFNRHQWYGMGSSPDTPTTYGHYTAVTGGRTAQLHAKFTF
jgi:hypothetical protein